MPAGMRLLSATWKSASRGSAVDDGLVEVLLLDVDVEGVQADAALVTDGLGQRHRLRAAGDEVGLEAVERLDGQPHAQWLRVRVDVLQPGDGPVPLLLRRGVRRHLADRGRHDGHLGAVETGDQVDAVLGVLHGHRPVRLVGGDQVALAEHERDRAPAAQAVLAERLPDLVQPVLLRLPADLDALVAVLRQPRAGHLERLGPHPVVHRQVHVVLPRSSGLPA
jgi:hypothetical protein